MKTSSEGNRFRLRGGTGPSIKKNNSFLNYRALLAVVLLPLVFGGCSLIGLGGDKTPVTDAAYFDRKMTDLYGQVMSNSRRSIRRAAALEFVNTNGKVSQLGKYLAEKFREVAVRKKVIRLVPKGEVDAALAKLGIANAGSLDIKTIQKLGDDLQVDTIMFGKLSDLQKGSDVDVTMKAVEVRSGELNSAGSVGLFRSKQVQNLLESF